MQQATLTESDFATFSEEDYRLYAEKIWSISEAELRSSGWVLDKTNSKNDKIFSKKTSEKKRYFKIVADIDLPPERLMVELRADKIGEVTTWNPTLEVCTLVTKLSEFSGIFYQKTAEGGGGFVASRDFVNVYLEKEKDDSFIIAYSSVTHQDHPPTKKVVRGWNEPGAMVISRNKNDPTKSIFEWMFCCDFKFRLVPEKIRSEIFRFVLTEHVRCLRRLARRILKSSSGPEDVQEGDEAKSYESDLKNKIEEAIEQVKQDNSMEDDETLKI